jgi:hypothetical protein
LSVAATLTLLAARLATITSPQALTSIYADPKEAVSLGEFPCMLLALDPLLPHNIVEETVGQPGLMRHDYTVAGFLFVGQRNTPLAELHSRVLPWPEAIGKALIADLTLGGAVAFIGFGDDTRRLYTYQIGPIAWADGEYWGIKWQIPVTEKISTLVG